MSGWEDMSSGLPISQREIPILRRELQNLVEFQEVFGVGNGDRTRDPRLGKTKQTIFLTP